MSKYRISKYDPSSRDERGYFTEEDWTSFSDIGKEYHGTVLTDLQYAAVEAKYIDAVTTVLRQNRIHTMIVEKLEKGDAPLSDSLKLFEEGTKLVNQCRSELDKAEQQVVKLMKGPDGTPVESNFLSEE